MLCTYNTCIYKWCLNAIQLLFTANLCCWFFLLQFMQLLLERSCILSSYTMIRTISNCNDCLSHRCHVHKRQCRCRSHRKIKVRTYWHRQSLKRATYSQNNKHKHTHTQTYRKRENITIGMFIVSFPFLNIFCWQTNKQTNAYITIIRLICLPKRIF